MPAVLLIDILDDLFTPLMLEIDVDVRRFVALRGDEALEQQVDLDRVYRRDAQAIADHRIRRRTAALAQDALALRELDDVVHRQEIRRIVQLRDQRQFLLERASHLVRNAIRIALRGALPGQLLQMLLRREAFRHRLARVFVAQLVEREAAGIGQPRGILQGLWPVPEQALHFLRRFQVPFGIGEQAKAGFLDGHMLADAGHHILQRPPLGRVIEHVIGGDEGQAVLCAKLGKPADAPRIIAAIEMADCQMRVPADIVAEPFQEFSKVFIDLLRRQRYQLLTEAMSQHIGIGQCALAFLRAPLAIGEQGAEPAVSRTVFRIAEQARRILEVEPTADNEPDLGNLLRCPFATIKGAHDSRQCIAVRDADRFISERSRLRRQLMRLRPALKEGEVGRDLKLDGAEGHKLIPALNRHGKAWPCHPRVRRCEVVLSHANPWIPRPSLGMTEC